MGGATWVSFLSLLNVQILKLAPDWVRARALAIAMLMFQGAVAAGSTTWVRRPRGKGSIRHCCGRAEERSSRRFWHCFCVFRTRRVWI